MYLANKQLVDMSFLESYSIFSVTTAHSECHMSYNIKQAIIIFVIYSSTAYMIYFAI